jgi:hypothetical protein
MMRIACVLAVVTVVGLVTTAAFAAFDGENGKIAFASDSHLTAPERATQPRWRSGACRWCLRHAGSRRRAPGPGRPVSRATCVTRRPLGLLRALGLGRV